MTIYKAVKNGNSYSLPKKILPLYCWTSRTDPPSDFCTLTDTPSVGDALYNIDGTLSDQTVGGVASGYILVSRIAYYRNSTKDNPFIFNAIKQ